MSSYMSEYEEYYRNINKRNNEKQKSSYIYVGRKNNNHIYGVGRNDEQVKYFSKDYWIRRIIRELSCALVILTVFMGLKYIKNDYVHNAYVWSKNILASSFNYDETVEAFNNFEYGKFKIKELNVGGFTVEDLKSDKISARINSFINYVKNSMNTQKL